MLVISSASLKLIELMQRLLFLVGQLVFGAVLAVVVDTVRN